MFLYRSWNSYTRTRRHSALTDETLDQLIDALRSDPQALAAFVERASPNKGRTDGWTPFARRLFLEVLAETGRVSRACEYAQLPRSRPKLCARDPMFAASWDAACELARAPLADALYEQRARWRDRDHQP